MKNLTKLVGFTAVLCTVNPSFADIRVGDGRAAVNATGRVGVASTVAVGKTPASVAAARRLPTMKYVGTTTTTTTTSSSDSSLMTEIECVDAYSECIRAAEVCGPDFEECTTNELFYAKKPQCNSVLLQCSSAGINALFGTTSTANLATKNANEEYVYPTAGSILGQYIEAGAINNRLDTSSCVKRYMSCVKKDNVCGENFELCTSNNDFKKQKIYCESTLARCQDEGKTELFGRTDTSQNPTSESRLGVQIAEGGELAAVNAVSTCYKVADQCILSACTANPYRCIVDSNMEIITGVDNINNNDKSAVASTNSNADVFGATTLTASDVSKYLRLSCEETIGGNKYCYMTANEGKIPTAAQITDEDNRADVFAEVYASRMNTSMRDRIKKIADEFDSRAKNACSDAIMSCAMRSCGSGLGSACYQKVFGNGTGCLDNGLASTQNACTINGNSTYNEIKTACEAIVNTDANCQYAAASVDDTLTYDYNYAVDSAFNKLFPKKSTSSSDPIGVISRLNASLAQNYNAAAIEQMAKQCKNTAVSCIRAMCGSDFTNCYRSRTDVMTDTYATATNGLSTPYEETVYSSAGGSMSGGSTNTISYDSSAFDASMNKVGGVLDFTIVRGLCINTVKEASVCDEHLKIQMVKNYSSQNGADGWGDSKTVRDAWVDAVSGGYSAKVLRDTEAILIGCRTSSTSNADCDQEIIAECDTVDSNGCVYDVEEYQAQNEYQLNMAANTLFREVMRDLELEAQAKYNAKLTKEQRMCVDANSGGIMGRKDISSVYQWVKLRNNRVPKNYSVNGLKTNEFIASNDLYGSFCRARVTVQSDDPDIQNMLQNNRNHKNWSTAYFAVGDVFTCGSWIPQSDLQDIATRVACKKAQAEGKIDRSIDCATASGDTFKNLQLTNGQKWAVAGTAIGGSVLGGVGGAYLTDAIQNSNLLGGLLQRNRNSDQQNGRNVMAASNCTTQQSAYLAALKSGDTTNKGKLAYNAAIQMRSAALPIVNRQVTTKDSDGNRIYKDEAVREFRSALSRVAQNCTDETTSLETDCQGAIASLGSMCSNVYEFGGQLANYDNNSRRQALNLTGAVLSASAVGITGAFAVRDAIKASNQKQFTEAEQEFMDNVGNHIYCFIGADEAGTYGDLIEISVE